MNFENQTDEEQSSSCSAKGSGQNLSIASKVNLPGILPLAHYSNNRNNTSQNYRELDMIILKAMSIPGSDASYQLRKKHSKNTEDFERMIGRAGQMIEMTGKALTTNLVITYYKSDTSSSQGVKQLKSQLEQLFRLHNPKLSDFLLNQIHKWFESPYFSDYLKHYRDFRTDISKVWCKIFTEKPFAWIRNTLDNIICDGEESDIIYPCSRINHHTSLSIFGLVGM